LTAITPKTKPGERIMTNNLAALHTPKNYLSLFTLAADRRYFSNPITVELLYSEVSTKLTFVRDPKRGHTYPTNPSFLKEVAR
jgi:hypothetical protein